MRENGDYLINVYLFKGLIKCDGKSFCFCLGKWYILATTTTIVE